MLFHPPVQHLRLRDPCSSAPADQPVIGFGPVEGYLEERVRQYPANPGLQPAPYVFVGWSSAVAWLPRCGAADASGGRSFVGLIDTVMPKPNARSTPDTNVLATTLEGLRGQDHRPRPGRADPAGRLVGLTTRRIRIIMEMVSMSGPRSPAASSNASARLVHPIQSPSPTSRPTAFDGNGAVGRPHALRQGPSNSTTMGQDRSDGGWGPIVPTWRSCIGGDHLSMVDEPYISAIGADLTARLNGLGKTKEGDVGRRPRRTAPQWPITTGPGNRVAGRKEAECE